MIAVLIFFAHTIFSIWVFVKSFQSDGLLQSFLNIIFIIIIFSVGWTVSDFIIGFIISDSGYIINTPTNVILITFLKLSGTFKPLSASTSLILPKDTISLLMLTTLEIFFYRFFYKTLKSSEE
jgi:hypothetical protein